MLTQPSDRSIRIMFVVFLAAILGLFGLEVATDYQPVKLTALFCFVMWAPLLVIHELGHAMMAKLFGCSIWQINLGFGRVMWRFHVGGAEVLVRAFLLEGFVRFGGAHPLGRLENALIYFAGPGIELLLAAAVVALGPDDILSRTDDVSTLLLQSFCLVATVGAVINLVPHRANAGLEAQVEGRAPTPNDGLGIVLSLLGRR